MKDDIEENRVKAVTAINGLAIVLKKLRTASDGGELPEWVDPILGDMQIHTADLIKAYAGLRRRVVDL
jgi:hypothetical protein